MGTAVRTPRKARLRGRRARRRPSLGPRAVGDRVVYSGDPNRISCPQRYQNTRMTKLDNSFLLTLAGAIRRLAWKFGRFERRWQSPQISLVDLAQQLSMTRPNLTLVQIGANDGVRFDPVSELRRRFELRGVIVEPLSDMHASLRKVYSRYQDVTLVQAAIHKTASAVDMYRVRPDAVVEEWMHGIASLSPLHHELLGVPEEVMETVAVPAMTLNKLLSDSGLERIDLLVMDCEGYDLDILEMLDLNTWRPAVIQFEHCMRMKGADIVRIATTLDRLRVAGYESTIGGEDIIAVLPQAFISA